MKCPACGAAKLAHDTRDLAYTYKGESTTVPAVAGVDPVFIINVRKKLALDQREAAEIFGGGVNAFSRYENGKTKPPLALVKLLRVLDRHPELLSEVRAA